MGYWSAGADGTSLHTEDTGLVWGDAPADVFDNALEEIARAFVEDLERMPTKAEIRAGLEFSLGPWTDDGRHPHLGMSSVCPCGKTDVDPSHV